MSTPNVTAFFFSVFSFFFNYVRYALLGGFVVQGVPFLKAFKAIKTRAFLDTRCFNIKKKLHVKIHSAIEICVNE